MQYVLQYSAYFYNHHLGELDFKIMQLSQCKPEVLVALTQ